jgi:hypothetical protein
MILLTFLRNLHTVWMEARQFVSSDSTAAASAC